MNAIANERPGFVDWLSLLVISFTWGSGYLLVKKALIVFNPTQIIVIKYSFSASVFMWIAFKNIRKLPREKLWIIFFVTLIGAVIPAFLRTTAQTEVPSATMGAINALTPVFAVVVGFMFYKVKIKRIQIVGFFLAFLGSGLFSMIHRNGTFGDSFNYYITYVLLAGFCYAISVNILKRRLNDIKPIVVISCGLFMKFPIMLGYFFFFDFPFHVRHVPAGDLWFAIGGLGIYGTAGAMMGIVLYDRLLLRTSMEFSSTSLYLVTFFALMWGVIDGEKLFPMNFISMALILIGVFIVNRSGKRNVPHYESVMKVH